MRLILLKILFLSLFSCYVSKEAECVRQLNKADALKVSRTVQLFVSKQAVNILFYTQQFGRVQKADLLLPRLLCFLQVFVEDYPHVFSGWSSLSSLPFDTLYPFQSMLCGTILAQWWEHSPPGMPLFRCGLSLLLVPPLPNVRCRTMVFLPLKKTIFPVSSNI